MGVVASAPSDARCAVQKVINTYNCIDLCLASYLSIWVRARLAINPNKTIFDCVPIPFPYDIINIPDICKSGNIDIWPHFFLFPHHFPPTRCACFLSPSFASRIRAGNALEVNG